MGTGNAGRWTAPWVGKVSWWGRPTEPPAAWLREHELAESGGYIRSGSRWTRLSINGMVRLPLKPVAKLFGLLLYRRGAENMAAQGYTIDC